MKEKPHREKSDRIIKLIEHAERINDMLKEMIAELEPKKDAIRKN